MWGIPPGLSTFEAPRGSRCSPRATPAGKSGGPRASRRPMSEFLPKSRPIRNIFPEPVGRREIPCHKLPSLGGWAITPQKRQQASETRDRDVLMTTPGNSGITRRGVLRAFAASAVAAAPTYANAFGFLRGSGDIRRLRMYSTRSGEMLDTIYWIDGEYIPEALAEINHLMRDWRSNEVTQIDARAVDIMAASHSLLDVEEPYMLLSGYRSPQTNAMLRSRSRGVARNSLHMKGQAADLRMKARSVQQMARAASACAAGGVGKYSRSNFVHMDCGPVRTWGR